MNLARLQRLAQDEAIVAGSSAGMGLAAIGIAHANSLWIAAPLLLVAGACLMIVMTILNVAIQVMAPRWVGGRTLAAFQAATAGGIASGSWIWGALAVENGLKSAIVATGALLVLSALIGRWLRLPHTADMRNEAGGPSADPEVALAVTGRSGPRRDRRPVPRSERSRAALLYPDAGRAAQPAAQRRLWMDDFAGCRGPLAVDRALLLLDLARLSAPARPPNAGRARLARPRLRISCRRGAHANPADARASLRLGPST
nr:MFS transporter [Sphingopyxis lindanitolerans]